MTNAPTVDAIISRLRPRDIGGIVDQAFRLYRKHFWTFLAIVAVIYVPVQLLLQVGSLFLFGATNRRASSFGTDFGTSAFSSTETSMLGVVGAGAGLLVLLLSLLAQYLIQAAITAAVADSHLDRPVSFSSVYSQAFARAGPLFGYIGLQALIWLAIVLPIVAPLLLLAVPGNNSGAMVALACVSCLIFPAIIFILYLYIRLTAVVPAIMIEGLGPVEAIRRSWNLIRNYWWRTLGITLLLGVIEYVIAVGPAFVIVILVLAFIPGNLLLGQALGNTIGVLASLFFIPIQLTAMTLYYFDLRVRKEGFDLDAAMRQAYQYGYGSYGYPPPPGYSPAPGYGGYGQPAPGQYPQPQGPAQPNPMYPPTLGYEQPSQQGQQGGTPGYGYGNNPNNPAPQGYQPPATPPQETINLGAGMAAPTTAETGPPATSPTGGEGSTPYGNDPLGLYPSQDEPRATEQPRQTGPTPPEEGESADGSDAAPEKREPEV